MYIVSPFVFDKNLCPIVLNFFLYIKSNRCSSEYGYVDNYAGRLLLSFLSDRNSIYWVVDILDVKYSSICVDYSSTLLFCNVLKFLNN